jgi:putative nucleotidyltransferase with HDIG domain
MEQQTPSPTDRRISEVEAIQALTAAASAHDGGTHDHSQRMIQLTEETARYLGRSEDEVHLMRLAALLHDIGKIGIPDAILHKPGPLTNEEWAIMRSHPEIGKTILEQTGGILRLLSNTVVAHHERWDGTGYPSQLSGDNIPLGARILSVVDSYDAIISRRAYREPRPIEEAKAELQRCAGSQFDPQVVAAFLAVLDKQKSLLVVDVA